MMRAKIVAVLTAMAWLLNANLPLLAQDRILITEFMAGNRSTLADEDGEYADWVELYNGGTNTVNLEGWYLTDNAGNLTKWQFPATNLAPSSYLIVWASSKDRRVTGLPLHTSWSLSTGGEFLGLIKPDGTNVVSAFSPTFPQQFNDISFGISTFADPIVVVGTNSPARVHVPTSDALSLNWIDLMFNDSTWLAGTNGVGYDGNPMESGQVYQSPTHAYYFDASNAADSIGTVNGTLEGSPTFATDRMGGKALNLNGSNQAVTYPTMDFTAKFTIAMWIKPTGRYQIQSLVANTAGGFTTAGFKFFVNSYNTQDGLLVFEHGNGSAGQVAKSQTPVDFDQWNHVAIVVDRAAGKIWFYKNGVDVTDPGQSSVRTDFTTSAAWYLGRMGSANYWFPGLIDDLVVYNNALSAGEIAGIYGGNLGEPYRPLIKTDVLNLMSNVNASAYIRLPFTMDDPASVDALTLRMKYDDGFAAYLNGIEVARRSAPSSALQGEVANFTNELSGTQGANNWYFGYYNAGADANGVYNTSDFIEFAPSVWNGSAWDVAASGAPWTVIGQTTHPNGNNSAGGVQWTVSRWMSEANGSVSISIILRKQNTGGGNGTTGKVFVNGVEKWTYTIGGTDGVGITTNIILAGINVGDLVDFVLTPRGTDGTDADSSDGTYFFYTVNQLPGEDLTWNSTATALHTDDRALLYENFDISNFRDALQAGTNILAIHGLNITRTNVDFLILPELNYRTRLLTTDRLRYFTTPTPGALNTFGTAALGARISEVIHTPAEPGEDDDLLVTARITPTFDAIGSVNLYYRVMFGGTVVIAMRDDGTEGDAVPGDGLYTARIPASAAVAGQMIRYYLLVNDASGVPSRWPLYDDPVNSPQYLGTMVKTNVTSNLPVLHWFTENHGNAGTTAGSRGALFFMGELYDNIWFNLHGQSSQGFPKKSYDVDFNPGYNFRWAPGQDRVDDINLMTTYPDKAHMRNILAWETYRDAGSLYHWTVPIRVHTNGAFFGDYAMMENGDAGLLKRNGLDPNGAFYKMYNTFTTTADYVIGVNGTAAEKKTRKNEGNADLVALYNGVVASSGNPRTYYIMDNINLPATINFLAARAITADRDCCHKNYYYYRDTEGSGQWAMYAWDVDLSFGRSWTNGLTYWDDRVTWNNPLFSGSNNGLVSALYNTPEFRQMYVRRIKQLQYELMQPTGTPANELRYEKRVDELTALLAYDSALDLAKWGTWGNGAANSTCCILTQPQAADIIKYDFLPNRRLFLEANADVGINGSMPAQSPNAVLQFFDLDYNPVSGNQAQEYICLTNPQPYALDVSGWQVRGAVRWTFEPGTVVPSGRAIYVAKDMKAFRARTVGPRGNQGLFLRGNYDGQLSAWGESLEVVDPTGRLVATTNLPSAPSLAQQYLRVTELMYRPSPWPGSVLDADEYEYLELANISATETLSLTNVHFSNGIEFAFTNAAIMSLSPGGRLLLVKNPTAFAQRYGSSLPVAGAYLGSLNNGGETIRLNDARGEKILEFTYNNSWYPVTDGLGFALTVVNEQAPWTAWSEKTQWRASGAPEGTPGQAEAAPTPLLPVLVNEVLTRPLPGGLDAVELFNPNAQPVAIGGWFITDDFRTPAKFRIPEGTTIQPGAYLVFNETDFMANPVVSNRFALGAKGDEVYLFSADTSGNLTGYYHGFDFGGSSAGVSFGRHVISSGADHFVAQTAVTLGTNNAGPLVGPVVISEIMFRPQDLLYFTYWYDNEAHEFIELLNISASPVELGNTNLPYRLRDGVSFSFPATAVLAPGERLLVVSFDPLTDPAALADFRARYNLSANLPIFGPYSGQLNNAGENVELVRDELFEDGTTDPVLVDKAGYDDGSNWPCGADGSGWSLQRLEGNRYGNDPLNWVTALPTAGAASLPKLPGLPAIVAQPQPVALSVGGSFQLQGEACAPAALTYQWLFNGNPIPGATNTTLVISGATTNETGAYALMVQNSYGAVTSEVAWVAVQMPPTVVQQPASQAVLGFSTASLGVGVGGTPPFWCQWKFNGVNLLLTTNTTLVLTNVQKAQQGQYQAIIWNAAGQVTSALATLTVNVPAKVLAQPLDITATNGNSITFSPNVAGDSPVGAQWYFNQNPLLNATNAALTLTSVSNTHAGAYFVVVSNAFGMDTSAVASLTVLIRAKFLTNPSNEIVTFGEPLILNASVEGDPPFRWVWQKQLTPLLTNYTDVPLDTFVWPNMILNDFGLYRVAVTNIATTGTGVGSGFANVSMVVPPHNREVVAGSSLTIRATVAPSGTVAYQWQREGTNLPGATTANLALNNITANLAGQYRFIVSNNHGRAKSYPMTLTVRDSAVAPAIVEPPTNTSAPLGGKAWMKVVATGTEPMGYQWYFKATNLVAGGTNIFLQFTNVDATVTGAYTVVVTNPVGIATSAVAQLTLEGAIVDNDNDGLPDDWEQQNGLVVGSNDSEADPDDDGLSNREEYLAGTHPMQRDSVLKLEAPPVVGGGLTLRFEAVANRPYTIEYRSTLGPTNWLTLDSLPAAPSNRIILLPQGTGADHQRYYRIGTPGPQ